MTADVQAGLGALEARAHAAAHGADLSELGARLAVADSRPRELLERIESTRLMMARRPLVRPPDDATLADLLAELRQLTHAMADADQPPQQRQDADRRRVRVEAQIRRYARMAGATAVTSGASLRDEVGSALGQLGDRRLVAHANLDGRLLTVTIVAGRARLHDLGPVAPLRDLVDALAFTLHRLNRAPGSEASRAAAGQLLRVTATELGERVLPPDVLGGDEAIVVVPTGVLHGVPWGALPQLTGRPVSLSPSLTGWAMAARAAAVADRRPAGFVAGPGLRFAEAEVRSLASRYRTPAVLTGDDATSDRCIGLLGTSSTAHLACHGSFRADNPLFSTLRVADGAVTVYDLERVGRMARTVVLSACSVGTSTEVQGGTLLGLSSALMVFGAASIVAPLSPVDDAAVGATMHRLHDGLLRGLPPSVALSRAGDADQEELDPTAVAFVAIGA